MKKLSNMTVHVVHCRCTTLNLCVTLLAVYATVHVILYLELEYNKTNMEIIFFVYLDILKIYTECTLQSGD